MNELIEKILNHVKKHQIRSAALILTFLLIKSYAWAAVRIAPIGQVPRSSFLINSGVTVRLAGDCLPDLIGIGLPRGTPRAFDGALAPVLRQGPVAAFAPDDTLGLFPLGPKADAPGVLIPLSGKGTIKIGPARLLAAETGTTDRLAAYRRLSHGFDGAKNGPAGQVVVRGDQESLVEKRRTRNGVKHLRWDIPDPNRPAAFSPDGTQIVQAADQNTLRVLEPATGRDRILQRIGKARAAGTPLAHTGRFVTTVIDSGEVNAPNRRLRVWDLVEGRARDLKLPAAARSVAGLKSMPDGRVLVGLRAASARDLDLAVLDPAAGKLRVLPKSRIYGAFHSVPTNDSRTLLRVGHSVRDEAPETPRQVIVSYDIASGKTRKTRLPGGRAHGSFFLYDVSPEGKYLALTRDDRILVLDRRSGRIRSSHRLPPGFTLQELKFTDAGRELSYVIIDEVQVQTDRPASTTVLVRWPWKSKRKIVRTRVPMLSNEAVFSADLRFASDHGHFGVDIYDYENAR